MGSAECVVLLLKSVEDTPGVGRRGRVVLLGWGGEMVREEGERRDGANGVDAKRSEA